MASRSSAAVVASLAFRAVLSGGSRGDIVLEGSELDPTGGREPR